ncbi:uncharacterized protein LOC106871129 [Octopus bimaculoides]|uniref:uncharacterized protein LOC106871129 n=1 Tax=Octopus bimaculoides TaxID=37653 RepID=UPI0022E8B9B5|nr:uncharacterized protein LOC106871129 [Octopus bimaculoides]
MLYHENTQEYIPNYGNTLQCVSQPRKCSYDPVCYCPNTLASIISKLMVQSLTTYGTVSGMPPHKLELKNLNLRRELLNGTRLLVTSLHDFYIHGKLRSGSKKERRCLSLGGTFHQVIQICLL